MDDGVYLDETGKEVVFINDFNIHEKSLIPLLIYVEIVIYDL